MCRRYLATTVTPPAPRLRSLSEKEDALFTLDRTLPHYSGVKLCREYRSSGRSGAIPMIVAGDTTADKVTVLDTGVDDYLVKPIGIVEFIVRARALRRRFPSGAAISYRWRIYALLPEVSSINRPVA